jgi:hypothetical protein
MRHELWVDSDGDQTFCLAGPMGDAARRLLPEDVELTWTVDARSHDEAMTLYYEHMGWGTYSSAFPEFDKQLYTERGWQ